jgi:hypothetical protein
MRIADQIRKPLHRGCFADSISETRRPHLEEPGIYCLPAALSVQKISEIYWDMTKSHDKNAQVLLDWSAGDSGCKKSISTIMIICHD